MLLFKGSSKLWTQNENRNPFYLCSLLKEKKLRGFLISFAIDGPVKYLFKNFSLWLYISRAMRWSKRYQSSPSSGGSLVAKMA